MKYQQLTLSVVQTEGIAAFWLVEGIHQLPFQLAVGNHRDHGGTWGG